MIICVVSVYICPSHKRDLEPREPLGIKVAQLTSFVVRLSAVVYLSHYYRLYKVIQLLKGNAVYRLSTYYIYTLTSLDCTTDKFD